MCIRKYKIGFIEEDKINTILKKQLKISQKIGKFKRLKLFYCIGNFNCLNFYKSTI